MAMTPTQLELKRQELEAKIAEAKNDVERKKYELELKKYKAERPFDRASKIGTAVRGIAQLIPGKFRINDPSWYKKVKYAYDVAGKIQFTDPLTDETQIPNLSANDIDDADYTNYGICVLSFGPTLGGTDSEAVETQQLNLWKVVRGTATGDTNGVGPSNLMHYVLCWDSVLMNLSKMARLIALSNTPDNSLNRYKPSALIRSLGYDPEDISDNITDYVAQYNKFIKQLEAFNIPSGMDLFTKHRWLTSTVIKDRNILKSQFYMYDCPHTFEWDETNTALKGKLYTINSAGTLVTQASFNAWRGAVNNNPLPLECLVKQIKLQLNNIKVATSLKLINSEIQRAIDAGRISKMQFQEIDPNITMDFICHDEPLLQIKNTRVIHFSTNGAASTSFDITYNSTTDTVEQLGFTQASRTEFGNMELTEMSNYLLDATMDNPSQDDVMVMTRNIPTFSKNGNGVKIDRCGDIVVYSGDLFSCTYGFQSNIMDMKTFWSYMSMSYFDLNLMNALSQFDWLPMIFFADVDTSGSTYTFNDFGVFNELNNFALGSKVSLNALHDAAMLSLMVCDKVDLEK